ncbi:MAG: phospho-2-dehydro-3-deoxyheptonate aldolase [Verrucomicrobia bacterium]|nr:phospho-2-dehydro-3-deoxyheptonate aldolase [Verrucomicrobiota bacterium]
MAESPVVPTLRRFMHPSTSDLRIRATKPLIAPAVLEDDLPLDDAGAQLIARSRREIEAILTGIDPRLLVVVGPCSIHDPVAAVEYGQRLREVIPLYAQDLLLVMRVYFEKPRTVLGWKGLINDPFLDGSFQINAGLRIARKLMIDVTKLGLPVATEFLDTTLGQYYADLVSWGAIGARTVESQVHRELASGLSMPVGFKNRTDGDIQVAVDAIRSARHPHWFPSLTRQGAPAVMGTAGNEHGHLVLRGGSKGPNFSAAGVQEAKAMLKKNQLPPYLMVDCSHANSGKDPEKQIDVVADVAGQISAGETAIAAVMIESNLLGGTQDYQAKPLVYGRSITDGCLAWEKTLPLLAQLASSVQARRQGK